MAVGARPERHILCAHYTGRQEQRVLKIKLGVWLPLPEGLQRLTEKLSVLKTRQSLRGFLSRSCSRRAQYSAYRREDSRFTAVPFRFEEDMECAGCRSPAAFVRIEPPTPPLCHQLIASQSAPFTDGLRAGAMRHHSKGELIAPEVAAEPVVRDMNVHRVPF